MWCWGYGFAGSRLSHLLFAYSEDPPSSSPLVVMRRVSLVVICWFTVLFPCGFVLMLYGVTGCFIASSCIRVLPSSLRSMW